MPSSARTLFLFFLGLTLACAGASRAQQVREGFADVEGGRVWYRVVGQGEAIPLLVLHGGPGIPSCYLEPLAGLAKDRPVVFYDQLGCGNSPAPSDSSLWTIERFVKELGQVREALNLDEVHLYGHSWGAILAVEYMMTRPAGVRSLVLAGPALSLSQWIEDARKLLATLPQVVQETIIRNEGAGTTDSEEYHAAMMEFYTRYLARRQPWAGYLKKAFETMNPEIYGFMCGPSEFTITGTLRDYDCRDRLPEIDTPTLFISGQYDEVLPATLLEYQALLPGSELAILPAGGHLVWHDTPEPYLAVLGDYLRRMDEK